VPAYFTSDVHLRLDRPERGLRFARWVQTLGPADSLLIVGDLCDFWFATRQRPLQALQCPGLRALAELTARGGQVSVMAGNHDLWLESFYVQNLGVRWVPDPYEVETHGMRVHAVHGHLLGARSGWKSLLETRAFLEGFARLPGFLASSLEHSLEGTNALRRAASDKRHLAFYRRYADSLAGRADLALFGHIHRPCDDTSREVRMVVLGSWHEGESYLKVDEQGATLVIKAETA
jgi:UDP-2,3-diacylglucosamine hydrolase